MATPYVYGVMLSATDSPGPNQNKSTFTEATVSPYHTVFSGAPTPISRKLGFPLLVWRLHTRTIRTTNPRTAWLMIDPGTHLAPMEWQSQVGDVFVVRADRQPLSIRALTAFTDYVWEILQTSELADDAEEYDPGDFFEPGKLEEYMDNYPNSRNLEVDFR